MKLKATTHKSQILVSSAITENKTQTGLGLTVDQAALSWLRKQNQNNFNKKVPFIHQLAFIKCMLGQVHFGLDANSKLLHKESFYHRNMPCQHINDHHFSRCMRYLCEHQHLSIKSETEALPGDIVIFAECDVYTRLQWAFCGSAGRLYHVHIDGQHIACAHLAEQDKVLRVISAANNH